MAEEEPQGMQGAEGTTHAAQLVPHARMPNAEMPTCAQHTMQQDYQEPAVAGVQADATDALICAACCWLRLLT